MKSRTPILRRTFAAVGVLLLCGGAVYLLKSGVQDPGPSLPEEGVVLDRLAPAIVHSADYLNRVCDKDGTFMYRLNLNPDVSVKPKYNIVRHAGIVYALGMFDRVHPNQATKNTMASAAGFLKDQALSPVPGHDDLLAVWSHPELAGTRNPLQAKLGATGLGLVALMSLERVRSGSTSLEELRKMARFLVFMQQENGGFYSKFIPSKGGRDDSWTSLYYPGEAALGLLMLYEKDPSRVWLQSAADAIAFLARSREGKRFVEVDHWALLATVRLLPLYERCEPRISREDILNHAVEICESVLAGKPPSSEGAPEHGCFVDDGRTCPTATRLEGLLAALTFLPEERFELRARIVSSAHVGIAFLVLIAGGLRDACRRDAPRDQAAAGRPCALHEGVQQTIDRSAHRLRAACHERHDPVRSTLPRGERRHPDPRRARVAPIEGRSVTRRHSPA